MSRNIFVCSDCAEEDGLTPEDLDAMNIRAEELGISTEVIGSTEYQDIVDTVKSEFPIP